jgi:hypothetical protein
MIVREQKVEREDCVRYLKAITDDPSVTKFDKITRKFEFLREVIENGLYNGLLNCGPLAFEKLRMEHNGTSWVINLEAEVFE